MREFFRRGSIFVRAEGLEPINTADVPFGRLKSCITIEATSKRAVRNGRPDDAA